MPKFNFSPEMKMLARLHLLLHATKFLNGNQIGASPYQRRVKATIYVECKNNLWFCAQTTIIVDPRNIWFPVKWGSTRFVVLETFEIQRRILPWCLHPLQTNQKSTNFWFSIKILNKLCIQYSDYLPIFFIKLLVYVGRKFKSRKYWIF